MTETKHNEVGAINSVPKELHIDGQWRPGASTFAVEDPSTAKVLCRVADADADQGWKRWTPRTGRRESGPRRRRASGPRSCVGPSRS